MLHRVLVSVCLLPACVGLYPNAAPPSDERGAVGLLAAPGRVLPGSGDDGGGEQTDDSGDPGEAGDPGDGDSGAPGEGHNPLAGLTLWVDPDSNAAREADGADPGDAALFRKIADHAVAKWLGAWSGDVEGTVADAVDEAAADGAVRAFVVYNLPNRDCGGYSSGGVEDAAAYRAWVDDIAAGLAGRTAIVVLEPDGLSLTDCLSSSEERDRYDMLSYAASTLGDAGAFVYLDAGHSAWHPVDTMAQRLLAADVGAAAGFALNTSNFETTDDILAYGEALAEATGGAHFVADTARNGLGPTADHEWCNPDGRALGLPPTLDTGNPLVDGLLWIKAPGESDGACNGGPAAGTWWPEYALGLAERAAG